MRKDYEDVIKRLDADPTNLSEKLKMLEEHLHGIEQRVETVHSRLFGSNLLCSEDASKMSIPSIENSTSNCVALAYGVSRTLDEILERL